MTTRPIIIQGQRIAPSSIVSYRLGHRVASNYDYCLDGPDGPSSFAAWIGISPAKRTWDSYWVSVQLTADRIEFKVKSEQEGNAIINMIDSALSQHA